MSKKDQECLDIYMGVHISQLYSVCDDTREKWLRGEEIYFCSAAVRRACSVFKSRVSK